MPKIIIYCSLEDCSLPFYRKPSEAKRRKLNYCSRDCYKLASRQFNKNPYPRIWFNGKREYLHRVIYMQETGETLTSNNIIHHIDENPFNRDISNLEKLSGQSAHLHKHNYHRKEQPIFDDMPF